MSAYGFDPAVGLPNSIRDSHLLWTPGCVAGDLTTLLYDGGYSCIQFFLRQLQQPFEQPEDAEADDAPAPPNELLGELDSAFDSVSLSSAAM